MAIVGTAYVQIRALTDKINGDIQKTLNGQTGAFESAGRQYSDALNRGLRDGGVNLDFTPTVDPSDVESGTQRVNNSLTSVSRTADDVADSVTNAMGRAGSGGGSNFLKNFGAGDISSRLLRIFYIILFGVPAVGALVGALSALVSGLFAVGSAVGPAVSGLAVLPGMAIAAVSGIGALVLALKGVGAAYTAGTKGASTTGRAAAQMAKAQEGAARRVEDATRRVSDAQENAADAIKNAQRTAIDAESGLADAVERSLKAQLDVNRAREDARNSLIELRFSVEQAAISEGKAVIALERARERLAEFSELPVNHRLRAEAELNYRQAALDLEEARKNNVDTAAASADATQKGIEGSDQVVQAREAEANAADGVAQAQQRLTDTQDALTKTQRDGARQIADAQRDLADAMRGSTDQAIAASQGVDQFADAMSKLSPPAQAFVRYLISIRGEFAALKNAAGEGLFGPLTNAIKTLIGGGFLDVLANGLRIAGAAMGGVAVQIANLSADPFFQGSMTRAFESSGTVIGSFGTAITNLISYFVTLADAARPLTEEFAAWVATITGNWASDAQTNFTGLQDRIQRAGDIVRQLGDIFGLLWDSIKRVGDLASESGQGLLDSFEGALTKLRDLVQDPGNEAGIISYFDRVADNVRSLGDLFNAVSLAFIEFGQNPAVGGIADILTNEVIPKLAETLELLTAAVGPSMAAALSELVTLFESMAGNGGLEAFIDIIGGFAKGINFLISNVPGFTTFVAIFSVWIGSMKALNLIAQVTHIRTLAGGLTSLVAGFRSSSAAASTATGVMGTLGGKIRSIGPAISGSATALRLQAMYAKDAAKQMLVSAAASARSAAAMVANRAAIIATAVAQKTAAAATKVMAAVQWALNAAMSANPIGLIVIAIAALVAGFIWAFNNIKPFRDFMISMWDSIKAGWNAAVTWFGGIFESLAEPFTRFVDWIKNLFGIHSPSAFMADIGRFLVEGLTNGLAGIWDAVVSAWNGVIDFMKGVGNAIVDFFLNWTLLGVIISNWDTIIAVIKGAWDIIWGTVTKAAGAVADFFIERWTVMKNNLALIWELIQAVVALGIAWIRKKIDEIGQIVEVARAVFERMRQAIADKIEEIVLFIGGLGQRLIDKIKESSLYQAGMDIIQGLIDGARKKSEDAVAAIKEIGENIVQGVKDFFDIRSPSHVMSELGGYIIGGLIQGIGESREQVPKLLKGVFGDVAGTASGAMDWLKRQGGGLFDNILSGKAGGILGGIFNGKLEGATKNGGPDGPNLGGTGASLVAFAREIQKLGFSISEHPAFGGVTPGGHMVGSKHYAGRAIDVNKGAGTSIAEQIAIDSIIELSKKFGLKNIWRKAGHFNHAHFEYDSGGYLQPGSVGVNNLKKPERVLTPSNTQSFDRLVSLLEVNGGTLSSDSGPTQIIINAAPEHDIATLARLVSRELAFKR